MLVAFLGQLKLGYIGCFAPYDGKYLIYLLQSIQFMNQFVKKIKKHQILHCVRFMYQSIMLPREI